MKRGIDEILNLVQDSLEENISRESFDKTLQFMIGNVPVKSNSFSKSICLSIAKMKSELVELVYCLIQAFFAKINSLKSDLLTPGAPITNAHLNHSEIFINHLLDQLSFLKEQIKSKIQHANSLLQHESRIDDAYLSKKVHCNQQIQNKQIKNRNQTRDKFNLQHQMPTLERN